MAPKLRVDDVGAAPEKIEPGPITYFVGFERRGSSRYGIVTGKVRLSDGVLFDVVADPITQDLGETSHGVLAEFQKLAAAIP